VVNYNKIAEEKMIEARALSNTTSPARERVRGDGPDRKDLPAFRELTQLPSHLIAELTQFALENRNINDLDAPDNYQVSSHCPLRKATPAGFQHILLTHCPAGGDPKNEQNYTQWTDLAQNTEFYPWFKEHFPGAFRVRLSVLMPETEFSWHIDTNTSVACRCSVSLNEHHSAFEIKDRQGVHSVPLKLGTVYFTNTGWPHRVYNMGDQPRLNLVFGIKYDNISSYFEGNR
jgi:hypothetical protein